jgi:hypothetical protein
MGRAKASGVLYQLVDMETFHSFVDFLDGQFLKKLSDITENYSAIKSLPAKYHTKLRTRPINAGDAFEDVKFYLDGWIIL